MNGVRIETMYAIVCKKSRAECSIRNHKLVTRHFDLFAVSEPRDRIVLRVFHFALHLGHFALHHPQVLQRLLDNDISYNDNSRA